MENIRARILSASAGSGKTYRLAYKFVHDTIAHLNDKPYLYRAILAVTFTNKATEEMKQRILIRFAELSSTPERSPYIEDLAKDLGLSIEEISKRAGRVLKYILHDYSHFTILTIDKFFQRILRAFVKELRLDMNYNLEIEPGNMIAQGTDSMLDNMPESEELQQWILGYAQENLDENKRWNLLRSNLLSLGKSIFTEQSKLALDHATSKEELDNIISIAAAEVQRQKSKLSEISQQALELLQQAGLTTENFSLKSKWGDALLYPAMNGGNVPSKITAGVRALALSTDKWLNKQQINTPAAALVPPLRKLLEEFCDTYDKYTHKNNNFTIFKSQYRSYALLKDIHSEIEEICSRENMMILSETKHLLADLITDNDTPFIYEKTGNRFERYMIDEFQDTSFREWHNFIPLLLNAMAASEDESILIVGDVKQSIYRWRGGDWRILKDGVTQTLGSQNTITEPMKDNWRSAHEIVNFNNTTIRTIVDRVNSDLNAEIEEATNKKLLKKSLQEELHDTLISAYTDLNQIARSKTNKKGYVRVEIFEKVPPLIQTIEDIIARGYKYSDIMVLHRSYAEIEQSVELLMSHKLEHGAEFNIKTQESLHINQSDIVNFVIAVLTLSQDRERALELAMVNQFLGRDFLSELSNDEERMLNYVSQLPPEQAFERIVSFYHLYEYHDMIAYLQALHEEVIAFCTSKAADIQLFLKAWEDDIHKKSLTVEQDDSTIELMTVHKAKGLEKKIVIIPYCNWKFASESSTTPIWVQPNQADTQYDSLKYFPVKFNSRMKGTAFSDAYFREKVNLCVDTTNILYVAFTRAKEELYIFCKEKSTSYNTGKVLWEELGSNDTSFIEYGERETNIAEVTPQEDQSIILRTYPTIDTTMALRLPQQRYFEQKSEIDTTARNIGIMMHGILSQSDYREDVDKAIDDALTAGKIDNTQCEMLKSIIEREFHREEANEWFNDGWDAIYKECDIIHNDNHIIGTSRPDRVMVKGKRAVVVDYKFGAEKLPTYTRQIQRYMELLSRMGYTEVEGYIWYLTRSEIERVG